MKLLVVEDSPILGQALLRGLRAEGFVVDLAVTGEDALLLLLSTGYDAIVLDWMLPGISGIELVARLRGDMASPTPILVLSARSEIVDRIRGLDVGADDYVPKPFDFGELVARIRALGRRGPGRRSPTMVIGALEIDTVAKVARVRGADVDLTFSEYSVLEALALRRGAVLTKEWLLERLHDTDGFASANVVEVFVSSLRKKLRAHGVEGLITTRRGLGYIIPLELESRPAPPRA
jgi:DNA-binding response OmpR family regulator